MRYDVSVGLGFDKSGKPIDPQIANEFIRSALSDAARLFGGATAIPATGSYVQQGGELVVERSVVFIVYASYQQDDGVREWAIRLRDRLNQESVAFCAVDTGVAFV